MLINSNFSYQVLTKLITLISKSSVNTANQRISLLQLTNLGFFNHHKITEEQLIEWLKNTAGIEFSIKNKQKIIYLSKDLKVFNATKLKEKLLNRSESIELFYSESLNSTNDFLLREVNNITKNEKQFKPRLAVCIAEYQTKGRGRFDRKWLSEPFSQIALSFLYQNKTPLKKFQLLSIAIALEALLALKNLGFDDIKIKWPNDLYFLAEKNKIKHPKKLCGILIDSQVFKNITTLVMGLGLNLNQSQNNSNQFSSLEMINTKKLKNLTKNELVITLIDAIETAFNQLKNNNQNKYIKLFNQFDLLSNKKIKFKVASGEMIEGMNCGIDKNARLIIQAKIDAKKHYLTQGQISLN